MHKTELWSYDHGSTSPNLGWLVQSELTESFSNRLRSLIIPLNDLSKLCNQFRLFGDELHQG